MTDHNNASEDSEADAKSNSDCGSRHKEPESLSRTAETEATKVSVSQAIGALLHPITRELAALEERGIDKLKAYLRTRKQEKLVQENSESIEDIAKQVRENPSRLGAAELLYDALEASAEKDIDNEEVLRLWSSIIERIRANDSDVELLVNKLKELNTAEAEFLLHFSRGKHQHLNVNPTLLAISFRRPHSTEDERAVELAISLRDKGLLTQSFPVLRAIFVSLFPILFLLLFAEVNRPIFENSGINVSSANNVILMGVTGVMLGLSFLTMLKHKTRLTWIGEKLCKGANVAFSKTET